MKPTVNKKLFLLTIMMLVLGWILMSFNCIKQNDKKKPWTVPDASKQKKNPIKTSPESIKSGQALFAKHCKSCHGAKGLGDGPKSKELDTPSGDFSSKEFQAQTDGEIFYKTKKGRDDMPSFKKKIPDDEDVWDIVNLVRTFTKK